MKIYIINPMPDLKIIADEKIPFLSEFFSTLGILDTLPASEINQKNIRNYDVLFVRTVTKVNNKLLEGTKIKIIGSMTSGIDHIDRNYLRKNKIKLLYAPGSNSRSVAEYVITSLLVIAKIKNFSLEGKTVGIIGAGNVGTKVAQMCEAIGMRVLLNDPPKYDRTKNKKYLSFKRFSDADIITLHIPLTFRGKYKTFHLIDEEFLSNIKQGTILINTSRGAVIDERMLIKFYKRLGGLILDVWENEPDINIDLLKIADIATPHIAGYSLDGKFNASYIVYKNLCKILKIRPIIRKNDVFPEINEEKDAIITQNDIFKTLYRTILQIYNPLNDHKKLFKMIGFEPLAKRRYFEDLRRNYPVRREFPNYVLRICERLSSLQKLVEIFRSLGFKIKV
uniref:4-phosphoerythronate dehydrogenase n=1 Tax=candidate division WOR-3 bacterium TaxID=2052148 RepID=A0A7V1EIE0_UNCW3